MDDSLCFSFLTPVDNPHQFQCDTTWRKRWLSLRLARLRNLQKEIDISIRKQSSQEKTPQQDQYACCSRFRGPPDLVTAPVTCPAMGAFVPDRNTILRAQHDPHAPSCPSDSDDLIIQAPSTTAFSEFTTGLRRFSEDSQISESSQCSNLFTKFDSMNFLTRPPAPPPPPPRPPRDGISIETPAWTAVTRPPQNTEIDTSCSNLSTYLDIHRRLETVESASRLGFGGELTEDVVSEPIGSALLVSLSVNHDEEEEEPILPMEMPNWPPRAYDTLE